MRLWHKNLISVLPSKQLTAQLRELAAIAKKIILRGTPNHGLVNKVLDYPIDHFLEYSKLVRDEMVKRGNKVSLKVENLLFSELIGYSKFFNLKSLEKYNDYQNLYYDWHNEKYLKQCYYNLQEKYDCGLIPFSSYGKISIVCHKAGII